MKNFYSHLLLLTSLVGLTSCGSQSAGGKLEISQSFATTNTSFGGGLVISGKHIASGKTFSQSILSGKEMRMNLEQGEWKISAVGWEGGGTPGNEKPFAGNPFCGSVTANLVNSSTIIDLNINHANCNTFEFSAGHTDVGGVLRSFDTIVTCNTFFQAAINVNNPISGQYIADGSITDDFCDFPTLSPDLKSNVKAVKIYAVNKLPDQQFPQLGIDTGCLRGNDGNTSVIKLSSPTNPTNPYNGYNVKLPFNRLPLTIVTFEDVACDEPVATFHFQNGLVVGSNDFDHLLHERTASEMKLLLPANDLRRAKSALIGLLPSIKRWTGGATSKFPTSPSNLNLLTLPAIVNKNHRAVIREKDCGTFTSTPNILGLTCRDIGDEIEFRYTGGTTPGLATIEISDGSVTRRTFSLDVILEDTIFNKLKYDSQARVVEMIGHNIEDDSIFFGEEEDEKLYGVLSEARHMFSPDGAGGVLGLGAVDLTTTFKQACEDLSLDKIETVYNEDEMRFESYRVNIHDSVVASPTNYMCKTNVLSASDCIVGAGGIVFDKRMTIFDHKRSLTEPLFVMEFSCGSQVGRFEMRSVEIQGITKHSKRKIVSWNTNQDNMLNYQRLEHMKIISRDRFNGVSWDKQFERRNMARIQKIDPDNFFTWNYDFTTYFNGTDFAQTAGALFLHSDINGTKLAFRDGSQLATLHPTNPYSILDGLNGPPPSGSIADEFFMNASYPQTRDSEGTINMVPRPTGNNTEKIDSTLTFDLQSLGSGIFTNSFGSTFYTAP